MDVRALLGRFTRVWASRRETCRFPLVDGWSTDTPGLGHHNDPKREIFRFDIHSEMATETEFKTLVYRYRGPVWVDDIDPVWIIIMAPFRSYIDHCLVQ